MTDFDIAKKDAENATGRRFLYHKTPGAKHGELSAEESAGVRTLTFGTRAECQKFLEGIYWAVNNVAK